MLSDNETRAEQQAICNGQRLLLQIMELLFRVLTLLLAVSLHLEGTTATITRTLLAAYFMCVCVPVSVLYWKEFNRKRFNKQCSRHLLHIGLISEITL